MTIEGTTSSFRASRSNSFSRRPSCLVSQPSYHTAKITVNHWQLRDLVHPSSANKNEILYTFDDSIKATDKETDKVTTVAKLDYHPRCFREVANNIVSGGVISSVNNNNSNTNLNRSFLGQPSSSSSSSVISPGSDSSWRGLFTFHSRETNVNSTIRLGSYINNSVSLSKVSNSEFSSFVCNNDMSLYNAVISNSQIVIKSSINLDSPLNHSALSDDQKTLVVVGDCSNIFVLHPDQMRNGSLRQDNIVETPCDSGFSTSFDSSGIHFATCFQDGTTLVYDVRNLGQGPLKEIYSTRKSASNGAFRCVKYSRGTDDLLIISEHVGRVHVVDTRDFNNHQVIMLPVNSLPTRSNQPSSTSLNNLSFTNSLSNDNKSNVFIPRVLDYNDVLNYEGNLVHTQTRSYNHRNSFGSRSSNNFNLLAALAEETIVEEAINDDSGEEGSESENHELFSNNRRSTTSITGSEFDYSDNEISGVDWYENDAGSHIIIGCEKGLVNWDIDSWSRRSFPSYQFA